MHLLLIGLLYIVTIVLITHFVIRPGIVTLYDRFEPWLWHVKFKAERLVVKSLRKVTQKVRKLVCIMVK